MEFSIMKHVALVCRGFGWLNDEISCWNSFVQFISDFELFAFDCSLHLKNENKI